MDAARSCRTAALRADSFAAVASSGGHRRVFHGVGKKIVRGRNRRAETNDDESCGCARHPRFEARTTEKERLESVERDSRMLLLRVRTARPVDAGWRCPMSLWRPERLPAPLEYGALRE
jgi:hypothetical protein